MTKRNFFLVCLTLFMVSAGVRLIVWQNNKVGMDEVQHVVTAIYFQDSTTLLRGDLQTFIAGPNPPSDATILLHPPGYPILIAAVGSLFEGITAFRTVQILINSLAPILVFLIAFTSFGFLTAAIAGFLAAMSPQFAYHSALLLPDELSVLPILLAVYALVRALKDKNLAMAILCGASIGVSCWLRSNALVLPLYFAAVSFFILPKEVRAKFCLVLIASFIVVISPITIRNLAYFHAFIPLSLGMGTTFVEGLGDYEVDGTLGLPKTDQQVMELDARLAGRPDYYGYLYNPDGVERERARMRFGLQVVAENPVRYLTSVIHRGISTFRFERIPVIAPERDERTTTPGPLYALNMPLKLFQRLFVTAVFLPLILFGLIAFLRDADKRTSVMILMIVPLYYMTVQALIHTEYRYVLATPHILLIVAAGGISFLIGAAARRFGRSNGSRLVRS